jgi:hypothetical protein
MCAVCRFPIRAGEGVIPASLLSMIGSPTTFRFDVESEAHVSAPGVSSTGQTETYDVRLRLDETVAGGDLVLE